ncbi:hypothetical protein CYMTET_44681 [Cymbomonas tetramitiformis]|uniref:Uncharacterized protein n=1 Tax=Cymbomonas tetramitiformis TaxID=36881 RepID=A0AAE0F0J2_9CHLO|nr:hypothetical protein CYMTET_44681 [Cymbomonas tetramitiformis]
MSVCNAAMSCMPLSNDESWKATDFEPDEYARIDIEGTLNLSCIKVVGGTRMYHGTRTIFEHDASDDTIVQEWIKDRESKAWMFFGAIPTAKSYGFKTNTVIHFITDSERMYAPGHSRRSMQDDYALAEWDQNKLSESTLSSITKSLTVKGSDVHKARDHTYKGVPFAYTAGKIGVVLKFTLTRDFHLLDMTDVHNLRQLHELGKRLSARDEYDSWNTHLEHGWYDQTNDKYRRQSTYESDFSFLYAFQTYLKEHKIETIHGIIAVKDEDSNFHSETCIFEPVKAIQAGVMRRPTVHERPPTFEEKIVKELSLPSLKEFVRQRRELGDVLSDDDTQKEYVYSNFAYGVWHIR